MESQAGLSESAVIGIVAFLVAAALMAIAWVLGRRGTTSRAALIGWVTAKATLAILAGISYGAFLQFNGKSTLAIVGLIVYFPIWLVTAIAIPGVIYLLAMALPERWRHVGESDARRFLQIANAMTPLLAGIGFAVGYYILR